jgi:hypothetical protein
MFSKQVLSVFAFASLLSGMQAPAHGAGDLRASATCEGGNTLSFSWDFYEVGSPLPSEWVGYDVMRRTVGECEEFVRVNAKPFPRILGMRHSYTYTEPAPAIGTTYEYQVIMVNANRERLHFSSPDCDNCGRGYGMASCPNFSGPVTQGTLKDWGFLHVIPCPHSCYDGFFFYPFPFFPELRAYAGTSTVVRFYGGIFCAGPEGCEMVVHHYEVTTCEGVTTALRKSWGRSSAPIDDRRRTKPCP